MPSAISVQDLTKRYGNVVALNNVSFEVEKGEIFGFLGPNGAGKSTTVRILTGLIKPDGGKAFVMGYDILKNPLRQSSIWEWFQRFQTLMWILQLGKT